MPFERLREKQVYLLDRDKSPEEDKENSLLIQEALKKEIWDGEFSYPIIYHGITRPESDTEQLIKEERYKISDSDNCLFPEKYINHLIYTPNQGVIHWFILKIEDLNSSIPQE